MLSPLTDRQQQVLEIIRDAIRLNGVPPTLSEIGSLLKITSLRGVTDHLEALERKGWLIRTGSKGSARCWKIVGEEESSETPAPFLTVPIVGSIAAGALDPFEAHVEDRLAVPTDLVGNVENLFILRVRGESMIGDSICDGDLAILHKQATARSGDIIAAYIDHEATLKHYVKIGSKIELHASNPDYPPIPFAHETAQIMGKLLGLMRRCS